MCMYLYMHTYLHTYIHTYQYNTIRLLTYLCVYINIHIYIYIDACEHVFLVSSYLFDAHQRPNVQAMLGSSTGAPRQKRVSLRFCHLQGLGLAAESLKSKPWRDSLGLSYLRSLRPNLTFLELCYLSCYASSLNS